MFFLRFPFWVVILIGQVNQMRWISIGFNFQEAKVVHFFRKAQIINGLFEKRNLIVIFGDLSWRAVGSLGLNTLHTFENDTGPDDANHAQMGMFIYHDPKRNLGGRELKGLQLYDIAPTVLREFGMDVPGDMIGKVIECK